MEKGALRCDANVSLRKAGETTLGVKTELKNLNSIRAVKRALEFEINRQSEMLEAGQGIAPETRLWNEPANRTELMRTKEEADDYRYFPEPDLPPLVLSKEMLTEAKKNLPELPETCKKRLISDYNLTEYEAGVISKDRGLVDYFEVVASQVSDYTLIANWLINILLQELDKSNG
jgi:aspartyl-tRNA(Asn)/glutamyl-tRNA(Gln) amidotransferase subunit B